MKEARLYNGSVCFLSVTVIVYMPCGKTKITQDILWRTDM